MDSGLSPEFFDEFGNFSRVLRAIGAEEFYAYYRLDSGVTHAGYLSGAAYWDDERFERGEAGFGWKAASPGTSLRVTAVMLAMALDALPKLVDSPKIVATVDQVGGELGIEKSSTD